MDPDASLYFQNQMFLWRFCSILGFLHYMCGELFQDQLGNLIPLADVEIIFCITEQNNAQLSMVVGMYNSWPHIDELLYSKSRAGCNPSTNTYQDSNF